jgi:hypothetical protein
MKRLILFLLLAFVAISIDAQSVIKKVGGFESDAYALSSALWAYSEAQLNSGDTITTRATLESKYDAMHSYDVQAEMNARPDLQGVCHLVCALIWQACYRNSNYGMLSWQLCLKDYRNCMTFCGEVPPLRKQ